MSDGRRCRIRFTDRRDGDASDAATCADERHRWSLPNQVHGARVLSIQRPADATGVEADALLTTRRGPILAIRTADCVPVALYGRSAVAAVHAGWRGLRDGVVHSAVDALRRVDGGQVRAVVGPHISAAAYEFGVADLERLRSQWGEPAVATTAAGSAALDLAGALSVVCGELGVELDHHVRRCTALDERYYSHRARQEPQRLAMLVELIEGVPK